VGRVGEGGEEGGKEGEKEGGGYTPTSHYMKKAGRNREK
jgi:hypothetical protein